MSLRNIDAAIEAAWTAVRTCGTIVASHGDHIIVYDGIKGTYDEVPVLIGDGVDFGYPHRIGRPDVVAHLPGRHEQKDHGRRKTRPDFPPFTAEERRERRRKARQAKKQQEATGVKPAPSTPAQKVTAGDFSDLKKVGGQKGSTPGGLYEAPDGSRWYVKAQKSDEHAANEMLASSLYRAAGIDVPEVVRGGGAPDLPDGPQTASRMVDNVTPDAASRLGDDDWRSQAREGFAVDAWLANWDVAGASMDNVVTADGKPWRIDLGGTMLFRAQGGPKGAAFGDTVNEWMSLRDSSTAPQASKIFAGASRPQLVDAITRVRKVTPAKIRALAESAGLADVADRLIARRQDLISRLPALRVEARRHAAWEKRGDKAAKGAKALDAAPHRLTLPESGEVKIEPAPVGWAPKKLDDVKRSLAAYRGSDYSTINGKLRGGKTNDDRINHIDDLMEESALRDDVVVYRGFWDAPNIFGSQWNNADVVGMEWTDSAYASTSVDPRVAEKSFTAGPGSVVMRILVPRGVGAVRLSDMAGPNGSPWGIKHEAELLLERGQRRRVVADHGRDSHGRRILDVEVVE